MTATGFMKGKSPAQHLSAAGAVLEGQVLGTEALAFGLKVGPPGCEPDRPALCPSSPWTIREQMGSQARRLLCPSRSRRCLWPVIGPALVEASGLAGVWSATCSLPFQPALHVCSQSDHLK